MNLIKTNLTFEETLNFIDTVANSCFIENEDGTQDYKPMLKYTSLQANFVETFTDYIFTEDFDTNYQAYMSLDIDDFTRTNYSTVDYKAFNSVQFNYILKSIDEEISFRKQKLLSKSPLDELLTSINSIVKKMDESMNFKDIATLLPQLAKLGNDGFDQKQLVELILNNRPQDHKKPKKNAKKTTGE